MLIFVRLIQLMQPFIELSRFRPQAGPGPAAPNATRQSCKVGRGPEGGRAAAFVGWHVAPQSHAASPIAAPCGGCTGVRPALAPLQPGLPPPTPPHRSAATHTGARRDRRWCLRRPHTDTQALTRLSPSSPRALSLQVFVGGLSWATDDARLRAYFQNFGDVAEVR